MTHHDLKTWRDTMGYSQRAAAEALGMSLPAYQSLERGISYGTGRASTIDRRTELACAALAAGLDRFLPAREAKISA
jgi:transcriptional regulator with XRE-family HTH domain